ncbi:FxLYD domain-containing protein [Streptomyces pacificus]|uniref:FxLYD domain-containing protein n=1 Tax=Streptomyces pacificus TaxID=2705029 RepID=UPI0020B1134C|nr:FxLYD domain-containing protein [Streptomyces pacificus]
MRSSHGIRNAVVAAASAVALGAGMTGCTNDSGETPRSVASEAGEAVQSATAAAASEMAKIKDGLNATSEVKAGPTEAENNRLSNEITATNPTDQTVDYTVLVNWKDTDGNLLDATVVSIDAVPPGGTKSAKAQTHRDLSGTPRAEIVQAIRH